MATDQLSRDARGRQPATTLVVALVPLAVAINVVAGALIIAAGLPLYLDTIGTFLTATLLGPWWGALTGILTNAVGTVTNGPSNVLFAPVNVASALVWGYGLRRFGLGRTEVTFFGTAVAVGIVTGALATPVVIALGYATGHPSDMLTTGLLGFGLPLALAVMGSSVLSSVADKIVCAYLGLAITAALPPRLAAGVALPEQPTGRRLAFAVAGTAIGLAFAFIVALRNPT
jgi:energy-coupling factor transport system substrate-specific component